MEKNKKKYKFFIALMIIGLFAISGSISKAESIAQQIQVKFNSINISVNGEAVNSKNILYEGSTYVPLRDVAEMLGKDVIWDDDTRTAHINDKNLELDSSPKDDGFKFRNVSWGDTKYEVKKSEGNKKPHIEDETGFGYENIDAASGFTAQLHYFFNKGRLYKAGYIFTDKHVNKNKYIEDYNELKLLLTKKYGDPSQEKEIWTDDLYKDDPNKWGMGIATGRLELISHWEVDNTLITLVCTGDNFDSRNMIVYNDTTINVEEDISDL